jgi:two-component system, OmpR family, alkaline phosphatase synthesis response regulator PhoP
MPARVLIADDNSQNANLLEEYLGGGEFEVAVAADGEETLALVRSFKPDVLLLDIMMPKLSGFEVCKRLKADSATRHLPVLMITALDQPSDIERAVEAGTDDFLTKPIHQAELIRRVHALIESRKSSDTLEQAITYIEAVERGAP